MYCPNLIRCKRFRGYTLVEVLIVISIFLLLAAIALPNVRRMISNQKNTRGASGVSTFIEQTRNRAIAEGRPMGILVERLGEDAVGLAASIRVRATLGMPAYSGDASNAVGVLADTDGTIPGTDTLVLDTKDNSLLMLSAKMITENEAEADETKHEVPPIQIGDLLELPGGKAVPVQKITLNTAETLVSVVFDLRGSVKSTWAEFPLGSRTLASGRSIPYRISRSPMVSSSSLFSLPRGLAIDLNLSGTGLRGYEFVPTATANESFAIVFGIDGKVDYVIDRSGSRVSPGGLIFLCVGDLDGVTPSNIFQDENRATSNLLNLDSSWIVIEPSSGRVSVSPNASITVDTTTTIPMPPTTAAEETAVADAISQARRLATLTNTQEAS